MAYRLEIAKTRVVDPETCKYTDIPAEYFEYETMAVYDDYNIADLKRCELCSKLNSAYVRMVEI